MYNDFLAMNATLPGGTKPSSGGSSGSGYGSLGQPTSDTYYSSMAKDVIAKGNVDSMSDLLDSLNGVDKNSLTDVQKSSLYSAKKKLQSALEKADREEGFGDYFSEIQDYISEMFGSAKAQSIPDSVWQKLNASYEMSDTVKKAYETTAQYLNQLSSGKTPYTDKLNGLIDDYSKRDPFSYNPDEDSLFQNALASAMRNGQTAMQDTMGQAAALTGGYGSSYATTAANNVYNQYINEAYDNLPQYYQMAMQAYGLEDERLLNEIGLVQQQDAKEYERLYNTWNANNQTANDLYSKEYNEYLGTLNQYQNNAGLILQSQAQQWDMMKGATSAALQLGNMYMDDYYNKLNAETQASQFEKELQYKYDALAQDQAQFESSLALKTLSGGGSGGSGGGGGGNDKYNPTTTEDTNPNDFGSFDTAKMQTIRARALNYYQQGGVEKLEQYLDTVDTTKLTQQQASNVINNVLDYVEGAKKTNSYTPPSSNTQNTNNKSSLYNYDYLNRLNSIK